MYLQAGDDLGSYSVDFSRAVMDHICDNENNMVIKIYYNAKMEFIENVNLLGQTLD